MMKQNKVYVEFRESVLDDEMRVKMDVLPRKWPGMDDYEDKEVAILYETCLHEGISHSFSSI
jgi:hypothetical protein